MSMGRKGKHRIGKVSFGIYVTEEIRALIVYLVDMTGITATDMILESIEAKAAALGVVKNGKILPKHKAAIEVIVEAYRMKGTKQTHESKK